MKIYLGQKIYSFNFPLWKNEYGGSTTIDAEEFLVTVTTNKGKETFHGKGIFPHNYEALKELLSDQYD